MALMNWLWSCKSPSKTAKLIRMNDGGGVERIKIKMVMRVVVAELMVENPNQFVCNLGSMEAGRRISALPAEEEIEAGKTYVLLPMGKLRCVVNESEMRRVHEAAKNKSKAIVSSKVLPVGEEGVEVNKAPLPKLLVDEEVMEGMRIRWKPSLRTIHESRSFVP